ncbi:ParA family protein [Hymenobacter defluvii]|uniref:ParA family protein n=1 Tax=Hymenobacter defluvii TaxID=2054411 RepID=UPI001FB8E48E|nr:ParA family protein [Hymenobacter defluvii]
MQTISFANHKGGVGKTTSTLAVAQCLASQGKHVLLLDCDAQCNLSMSFSLTHDKHIGHLLTGQSSLDQVVQQVGAGLYLVPSMPKLHDLERELAGQPGSDFVLREVLESVEGIDYCLIDTPPNLFTLTHAALTASNAVFIPTQPEYYSFEGLATLLETCTMIRKRVNPKLILGGVFFTKYSPTYRKRLHHDMVGVMQQHPELGKLLMKTSIRENVALAEAQIQKESVYDYAPTSNGASDYISLTSEILSRL